MNCLINFTIFIQVDADKLQAHFFWVTPSNQGDLTPNLFARGAAGLQAVKDELQKIHTDNAAKGEEKLASIFLLCKCAEYKSLNTQHDHETNEILIKHPKPLTYREIDTFNAHVFSVTNSNKDDLQAFMFARGQAGLDDVKKELSHGKKVDVLCTCKDDTIPNTLHYHDDPKQRMVRHPDPPSETTGHAHAHGHKGNPH